MAYKYRRYYCEDCGTLTVRKRLSRDPKVCFPCGVARLTVNSLLMHSKAGKGYDAWLKSNGPNGRPLTR